MPVRSDEDGISNSDIRDPGKVGREYVMFMDPSTIITMKRMSRFVTDIRGKEIRTKAGIENMRTSRMVDGNLLDMDLASVDYLYLDVSR